ERRKAAAEGRVRGGGEKTDVPARAEHIEHARPHARPLLRVEPNDARSPQPEVEALQPRDVPQQQAGANEEHDADSNLSNDERVAEPRRPESGVEVAARRL